MRITVIGATGMVGSRVTREAARRGHSVTAVARRVHEHAWPATATPIAADAGDPRVLRELLDHADAAVLSIRAAPAEEATFLGTTGTVLDTAAAAGTRLLVVGGAGALRTPGGPDLLIADNPAYVPPPWRAIAALSTAQLRACEQHPNASWVYLSPPAVLEPGDRTGRYRQGGDTLLVGDDGTSRISAEDLAVAVVDQLEGTPGRRHVTVSW